MDFLTHLSVKLWHSIRVHTGTVCHTHMTRTPQWLEQIVSQSLESPELSGRMSRCLLRLMRTGQLPNKQNIRFLHDISEKTKILNRIVFLLRKKMKPDTDERKIPLCMFCFGSWVHYFWLKSASTEAKHWNVVRLKLCQLMILINMFIKWKYKWTKSLYVWFFLESF